MNTKIKIFVAFLFFIILFNSAFAQKPDLKIFVDKEQVQFKGKVNITWNVSDENLNLVKLKVVNPKGNVAFTTELKEGEYGREGRSYILDAYILKYYGDYIVELWANDYEGNEEKINTSFYIIPWKTRDLVPPMIDTNVSSRTVPWNGTVHLSWLAEDKDPTDGIQRANFRIYNPKYELIYQSNTSSGNISFNATDLYYAGMYTIKYIAWDNANNKNFTEKYFGIEPWALRNN